MRSVENCKQNRRFTGRRKRSKTGAVVLADMQCVMLLHLKQSSKQPLFGSILRKFYPSHHVARTFVSFWYECTVFLDAKDHKDEAKRRRIEKKEQRRSKGFLLSLLSFFSFLFLSHFFIENSELWVSIFYSVKKWHTEKSL